MPHAPRSALARFAALFGAAAIIAGCSSKNPEPEAATPDIVHAVYDVRGRVVRVPVDDQPTSEFIVHHEPIPDFRDNIRNAPVGMNAMVMPFPLSPGLRLEGVEPGAIVLVTFEVDHDANTGDLLDWRATRVQRLPDDTTLDLGKATPVSE